MGLLFGERLRSATNNCKHFPCTYTQHMYCVYEMRTKALATISIDPALLAWIKELTSNTKRGVSGFVEDACRAAKKRSEKK
jgi:hypothetical protein